MPFINPLKARWRSGVTTFGYWASFANPWSIEFAGASGVDWILVDTQHGLIDYTDMAPMLQACRAAGVPGLVRVAANDFTLIGKALDAGAIGVVVPLVNTAAEAGAAVAACRYPPAGGRSFGPNRAAMIVGSLVPREVEDVACIVMVETREGLANVDAIAGTEGVDAILIGPSDLAIALGLLPTERTAEHQAAVTRIREACDRGGKVAGIVCHDGPTARRYADQGFRFLSIVNDIGLYQTGVARELAAARGS